MPIEDIIDVGADFDAYYPDLRPVTVQSINAVTGAVLASAAEVSAAKLLRKVNTEGARGGSVWVNRTEWWFRSDGLEFTVKTQDRVVEADGATWVIDEVNEVAGALVRCPVTRMRG